MALMDMLSNLWKSFGSKSVDDMPIEDLERERNRLRVEEDKILEEQDDLAVRERQLMEEGREAQSVTAKKRIAAKVLDVRNRGKTLEQRLSVLGKSLRIANGIHTIKENESFYKNAGLGGALADIPLERLIVYIERSPEGVEQSVDKMGDILEALSDAERVMDGAVGSSTGERDSELDSIMAEFAGDASGDAAAFDFDAAVGGKAKDKTASPDKEER